MNAMEKANAGLWLLKQAVLELVRERPGITPNEIRDELDLYSPNKKGDYKDTLFWGIGNILEVEGLTESRKVNGRYRVFLVEK